jgi:hypothetical protein
MKIEIAQKIANKIIRVNRPLNYHMTHQISSCIRNKWIKHVDIVLGECLIATANYPQSDLDVELRGDNMRNEIEKLIIKLGKLVDVELRGDNMINKIEKFNIKLGKACVKP